MIPISVITTIITIIPVTRKDDNYGGIASWGRPTSRQSLWAVLANFVLRIHTNFYCPASDQNSDNATKSATPISWNGAITWRSDDVFTRNLDLWPLTFDRERLQYIGCHVIKLCTEFNRNRRTHSEVIDDLSTFSPALRHAVTLTVDLDLECLL